ncbi:MAG: hypothetical protein QNL04_13980 [SAR324 cluster bacterium]|nr:hypothetical protein [SAR324 cluster bacterium]
MMKAVIIAFLLFFPNIAFAYVGPGLGGGVIASIVGVISAIFMLLVGVLWYPLKKFVLRFRKEDQIDTKETEDE